MVERQSLKGLYTRLCVARDPLLTRSRRLARYILPWLLPEEGMTIGTNIANPFSSTAARGASFHASRSLLTMFPPNTTFVALEPGPVEADELRNLDQQGYDEVTEILHLYEEAIGKEFERRNWRQPLAYAFLLLTAGGGNCALWFKEPEKKGGHRALSVLSMAEYAAAWDGNGLFTDVVVCEKLQMRSLPLELQAKVRALPEYKGCPPDREVEVYTGEVLQPDGTFSKWQEVCGIVVDGSEKDSIPRSRAPIRPVRHAVYRNQDWGISRAEMFYGDIMSLDGMSRSLLEGGAACARVLFGVKPNCLTSADELNDKPNLAYVTANPEDIFPITADKYADLQVVRAAREDLVASVAFAFGLHTAVQRDAERVTAEEIRFMAQEIEDTSAGSSATITREMQVPIVEEILADLKERGGMKALPPDIQPRVVTGVEALGKNHDLNRLLSAFQTLGQMNLPPESLIENFDDTELVRRAMDAAGVRVRGLVLPRAEVKAARQEKANAVTNQKLGAAGIKSVTDLALAGQQQQQQTQGAPGEPA